MCFTMPCAAFQYRVYRRNEFVPSEICNLMDQKTFAKARLYRLDKTRFAFVHDLFSQISATVSLYPLRSRVNILIVLS